MQYAKDTTVPVEKSKAEIETILMRYGATGFMSEWLDMRAFIQFVVKGRHIKFSLPLPDPNAPEFKATPVRKRVRSPEQWHEAWEQACRQRWRALALSIKAKLEAVSVGITTFEEEFLAHIVLPDGQTVGRWIAPQIESSYKTGDMPPMLLGAGE